MFLNMKAVRTKSSARMASDEVTTVRVVAPIRPRPWRVVTPIKRDRCYSDAEHDT